MTDFTAARHAMVDSQIHTMGVVNDKILEAFRTVRREDFAPAGARGFAYADEDMPVGQGRFIMEPVTHARLLQAAAPKAHETALDIGCATGYSTAILCRLVSRVVAVEPDEQLLSTAQKNWAAQGCTNITPCLDSFAAGCPAQGPYNLILLNGSVAQVPAGLFDQLAPEGRLLAIVRKPEERIGRAVLYLKNAHGVVGERILFDAAVPYLPGLTPRNEFVF